ncbi:hypothetical protein TH9_12280 [Thalassospira xiamenensis]|uniref:hypothetical protein n=1 Tax=Thalassospira xiamenensis TaxID=220697 RepID=UPI000DEDE6DE|nr:hypothetical protein [Thalassospira xiamenensis]RCK32501.1 hypothetical protein TH9_12280 [Thalassospira xiamenensis]
MRKTWNCKGSIILGNGCLKCDRCIEAVEAAINEAPPPANDDHDDGFNAYGGGPEPILLRRGA